MAANHASFAGQIWLWVPCWQLCSLSCLCLHTAQVHHQECFDRMWFAMIRWLEKRRRTFAFPVCCLRKQSSLYNLWFKAASSHVFILVLCAAVPVYRVASNSVRADLAADVACDVLVFFFSPRMHMFAQWWAVVLFACGLLTGRPASMWMVSLGKAGFPLAAGGALCCFRFCLFFYLFTVEFCYEQGPCEDAYFTRK